jgi:hypothetical protein
MSDGFLAFKWIGWGAAALLAVATVMPSTTTSQWNALKNAMQSPRGLAKKTSASTPTTTTTTTTSGTSLSLITMSNGTTSAATLNTAGYPELTMIPSNFDITTQMVDFPPTPTAAPDNVGAFRFVCDAGQILADDPIVFPGQPGKSHLHQFYGNTGANAYSTYESLRTTGDSTCMDPLNRSGYWMPAMLDGKGNVVRPDYVVIYYKRAPKGSATCQQIALGQCIGLPNGLRYIMGRDPTNWSAASTGAVFFQCNSNGVKSSDMATVLAACPAGGDWEVAVSSPPCWDGKNLDSADHRSHMAYWIQGSRGTQCPDGYPYWIPTFSLAAHFTIAATDDTTKWTFSSDAMNSSAPRGWSFHADWFGAWDPTAAALWNDNCLQKLLSCNSGDLGNGKAMKIYSGFSWTANPRLVPVPR